MISVIYSVKVDAVHLLPALWECFPRYAINGELNNGEGEGGTLVDIDILELVESLKGEAVGNL